MAAFTILTALARTLAQSEMGQLVLIIAVVVVISVCARLLLTWRGMDVTSGARETSPHATLVDQAIGLRDELDAQPRMDSLTRVIKASAGIALMHASNAMTPTHGHLDAERNARLRRLQDALLAHQNAAASDIVPQPKFTSLAPA